jgi:hypothetical protein
VDPRKERIPLPFALSYDQRVAFWDPVQPHHVRQATAEYDQLGQDDFLALHHFGRATAYLLILDDKSYDSKAILGVAYKYATGRSLGPHDFSGGVHGAGAARAARPGLRDRQYPRPAPVQIMATFASSIELPTYPTGGLFLYWSCGL